ncbi:MAG: HIT family protein [Thermoleophilia bacterium]|nr:HIT family protein [Thermoleophilia bacterium]
MSERLPRHAPPGYDCPFCAVVRGEDAPWTVQADVVWRNAETTAWVNPRWWEKNAGALLVVPNRHVENLFEVDRQLAGDVHAAVRRPAFALKRAYRCDGISTRQQNEPGGDQEVWHYHVHLFPRYSGDALYGSAARLTTPEERAPYAARVRSALRELGDEAQTA